MTYRHLLLGTLSLAFTACGGGAAAPAGTGASAEPVILVIDTANMADSECHVMDKSVMGKCDEASIAQAVGAAELIPVDTETMADQACHYMAGTIMGQCTPEETAALRVKHTILVDRQAMADQACHVMGNTIMGQCSPEDIERQVAAIAASW